MKRGKIFPVAADKTVKKEGVRRDSGNALNSAQNVAYIRAASPARDLANPARGQERDLHVNF